MASLRERAEAGTLTLIWRTVQDEKVCTDCQDRHNVGGLTLDQWDANGVPGAGHTQCGGNCRCLLLPEGLIEAPDVERLSPIVIKELLDRVDYPDLTPEERLRVAANYLLLDDIRAGAEVVYRGPMTPFVGQRARVSSVNAVDGALIEFELPVHQLPEFQRLQVYDLTDLVAVRG